MTVSDQNADVATEGLFYALCAVYLIVDRAIVYIL